MKEIIESKMSATDPLLFIIDEISDAVLALKVLNDQLAKVLEEPLYWKWAVLALHDALRGFMVVSLADPAQMNIMKDARDCPNCHREITTMICPGCNEEITVFKEKRSWGTRSEWSDYDRNPHSEEGQERKPPRFPRLIDFTEMYGRIKNDKYMTACIGRKKFRATKSQNKSVSMLHTHLRNKFIHFAVKSWSVYARTFVSVVKDILPIISFLAFESENIVWWGPEDELKDVTRAILTDLNDRVASLEKAYNDEVASRLEPSEAYRPPDAR